MSQQFGLNGDVPVPGDYDGDGKADIAVYRPTNGGVVHPAVEHEQHELRSVSMGPERRHRRPGRLRRRRQDRLAVYRPSDGTWHIRTSSSGYATIVTAQFGLPGDIAVPSAVINYAIVRVRPVRPLANLTPFNDFDGDRKADLTVFRPSNGTWFTLKSGANYTTSSSTAVRAAWGRPRARRLRRRRQDRHRRVSTSSGTWYILKSSDSTLSALQWGLSGDIPVPGDYDGDGKTDIAVFRPAAARGTS